MTVKPIIILSFTGGKEMLHTLKWFLDYNYERVPDNIEQNNVNRQFAPK